MVQSHGHRRPHRAPADRQSAAIFVAGCAQPATPTAPSLDFQGAPGVTVASASGQLTVGVWWSPAQPTVGYDAAQLAVTDATGAPLSGLTLTIVPWMPAHAHGASVEPAVSETSPGVYVATPLDFYMAGSWELRTAIARATDAGAIDDSAQPTVDVRAAEVLTWPGFALLANVVLPTGKAVGDGTNPASTDATGTGTCSVSLGVDLEKVRGPLYGALYAWLTYSGSSTVLPPGATASLTTSFPLQVTALAVAGYVFDNEAAAALYVNFLERGDNTLNGVTQPGTVLRLTTVGATGLLSIAEDWRLSASLYSDVLLSSFGRNQQAGAGLAASLVRAWR